MVGRYHHALPNEEGGWHDRGIHNYSRQFFIYQQEIRRNPRDLKLSHSISLFLHPPFFSRRIAPLLFLCLYLLSISLERSLSLVSILFTILFISLPRNPFAFSISPSRLLSHFLFPYVLPFLFLSLFRSLYLFIYLFFYCFPILLFLFSFFFLHFLFLSVRHSSSYYIFLLFFCHTHIQTLAHMHSYKRTYFFAFSSHTQKHTYTHTSFLSPFLSLFLSLMLSNFPSFYFLYFSHHPFLFFSLILLSSYQCFFSLLPPFSILTFSSPFHSLSFLLPRLSLSFFPSFSAFSCFPLFLSLLSFILFL